MGNMKIAVMQPYFFPYIGYYQMISAVDYLVLTDNYQYSKGGWINRNRILCKGGVDYITLPLEKDSHTATINDRKISQKLSYDQIFDKIHHSYSKSIFYKEFMDELRSIVEFQEKNLFKYLLHSLQNISKLLNVTPKFLNVSDLEVNPLLSSEEKIISICKKLDANSYINLPGGKNLYSTSRFEGEGIELKYIMPDIIEYKQPNFQKNSHQTFIKNLSIIDMIFNTGIKETKNVHLPSYHLIT